MIRRLHERVEERNANSGNVRGSTVELGHIELHLEFDQLYPDYVLVIKVGLAPFRKPMFGSGPTPIRQLLQPAASDDRNSIVWVHKLANL
jgi:hypothetical protein